MIRYLVEKGGLSQNSDLRSLSRKEKLMLAEIVEPIPEETYSVDDRNETLTYMSNRSARYSSFTAKEEILEFLKY
nr:hypothetical protein [uncultured Anaerotignum sp.]